MQTTQDRANTPVLEWHWLASALGDLTLAVCGALRRPPVGRRRRVKLLLVVLTLVFTGLAPLPGASATSHPITYKDFVHPTSNTEPSADKPQSKLWYHDGAWWSLMLSPASKTIRIHRLTSAHSWQDSGVTVDDRASSRGDALWSGSKLYVVSRTSTGGIRVYRFSYASGKYSRDSGFPVRVATGGTESVTVARDTNGRLWVAYTQASKVYMSYSTTSETTWSTPRLVPSPDTEVSSDDLSAVIAFGGKIGIMWSDQTSDAFRFAVHPDSASPTDGWSTETPSPAATWRTTTSTSRAC